MSITLTPKAAREVQRILSENTKPDAGKLHLRMRIVGGGCSGYQHKLDLDANINQKIDEVFELEGVPVVIDKRSMMYLEGVTLDFHDTLEKRGFSFDNPNAKGTCGCGSSFSM